jgi:hypothetical protein
MNGGQVATRGFLLQTLITVFEILDSLDRINSVRLEPSTDKDKTDFVIEYTDGRKKAVQVKSSQNQIGLPAVRKWARSLKSDLDADEYELILIGPCSGEVTKRTDTDGVKLPIPKSLDVEGMLQQASHRLDKYAHRNQMGNYSPICRELMVDALLGKLSAYSAAGSAMNISDLEEVFRDWQNEAEEKARQEVQRQFGDGTLTDLDALKEYSAHFDRAALQDSLNGCGSYKKFADALGELIELLNTGRVRGRFVAKRRADFANDKWRSGLGDVYHEVREMRELYTLLVRSGEIDEAACTCGFGHKSSHSNFETKKRMIVRRLNDVLADAGLPTIREGGR